MSQYTTDEVLRIMERWFEDHKTDQNFDATKPFKGFDGLSEADLSEIDLSRETIDAKAEQYREANPEGENPPWLNSDIPAHGINLQGANLVDVRLQRADLSGAQLREARLIGADLQRVILKEAWLEDAQLEKAQLQEANLSQAWLRRTNLKHAQLQRADLSEAKLHNACLEMAQLQEAILKDAVMGGANLKDARLQKANLSGAQLRSEADLSGAFLQGADLSGAALNAANLQRTKLRGANLSGIDLEEVEWDDHVLFFEVGHLFQKAESEYRRMKQYFNGRGQLDIAGEFHRRELLMHRKRLSPVPDLFHVPPAIAGWVLAISLCPLRGLRAFSPLEGMNVRIEDLWLLLRNQREAQVLFVTGILMGHGERPSWVLGWVVAIWLGFAFAYWGLDALPPGTPVTDVIRQSATLMISPGTTLSSVDTAEWFKNTALVQGFISYVLLALFLVTFVRKVSPR